ncbi:hypothetical protein [Allosphingosinicella humi]
MIRIDGAYLYEFGAIMRPVLRLQEQDTNLVELFFALNPVRNAIHPFLYSSVFSGGLRAVIAPASKLIEEIDQIVPSMDPGVTVDWSQAVPGWRISGVITAFKKFDAVLTAELQTSALYYVPGKGGFDTACLTDQGDALFPADLGSKVPSAVSDVKAGARCIAFDLYTAAGFHFHRANEAVLRAYFDALAGSANRPKTRNMGDYLKKMSDLGVGDARVIDVLKSLKDLHRNPLMHPDDVIATLDEALNLHAAIRAAIGYMLDRIPESTPVAPSVSSGAAQVIASMAETVLATE